MVRCNELMVGDWLANKYGIPMQITDVGDDYANANEYGNEDVVVEFDDKYIKPYPIPLKEVVLKKNGWIAHSLTLPHNIKEYYYVKDKGTNHLIWNKGTLSIWLDYEKNNDGVYSDIVIPCKYVHQLQQVLRFAGMTDLANNFIVI